MNNPKNLYFRVKENGAAVFRVDTENRQKRLDLDQIANLNLQKALIKPTGDAEITAKETKEIQAWIKARNEITVERQIEDIKRTIDHLNITTQWIQSKASEKELDQFSDDLLMAMHDLRMTIVRKKSDHLQKK